MSMNQNSDYASAVVTTPKIKIAFVWALALLPLLWGFVNTLMRAAKLFH
mgnify:CR=1 FL=1